MNRFLTAALGAALASTAVPALAANLAIFGNNQIASFYDDTNTVTIVTDAQIATPGFLDGFDAFIYTRDGFSFGTSLSVAAAAAVNDYVTGRIVLLNGDFQDDIGTANTDTLFTNVLDYVIAGGPGGYIGEFTGSFAAFATAASYTPIGLVNGSSGAPGNGNGGSDGDVELTAVGAASMILSGVTFPYNPGAVEFGADVTGVNPAGVLARFSNGNPAIIANLREDISDPVPAPAAFALFGLGVMALGLRRR